MLYDKRKQSCMRNSSAIHIIPIIVYLAIIWIPVISVLYHDVNSPQLLIVTVCYDKPLSVYVYKSYIDRYLKMHIIDRDLQPSVVSVIIPKVAILVQIWWGSVTSSHFSLVVVELLRLISSYVVIPSPVLSVLNWIQFCQSYGNKGQAFKQHSHGLFTSQQLD